MSSSAEFHDPSTGWARLVERYELCDARSDDSVWRVWFNQDAYRELLPGPFRTPIAVDQLCETAPLDIWPGFMLPDTLPFVSNDYGDWWCLRIDAGGDISEVVQWSHGGGDWLPIGKTIAQAALWDYVQNWRPSVIDVEQAAHEYPSRGPQQAQDSPHQRRFLEWLYRWLPADPATIAELLMRLNAGQYQQGLELMLEHDWSAVAVACELVEIALQGRSARLANTRLALQCGINWVPDFTSWLFDTEGIPEQARQLIQQLDSEVRFEQDWQAAEQWAERVLGMRGDLSWPSDVAGWAALRRGDVPTAIQRFYHRRHASAFTDQSVRMRSHWFDERYGKFSIAQLFRLQEQLPHDWRSDPYLQLLWSEPASRTRMMVRQFWLSRARQAWQAQQYAASYEYYIQAGWDLGAERMSDYAEILDGITVSAAHAHWPARAVVAGAHAECLRRRLGIR